MWAMTFPVTISVGHHLLPVHLFFEALAYFCGYRYYSWLRGHENDPINEDNRILIFIGAAAGAFLGSHLLGILEDPLLLKRITLLYFMGNTTIVGGLLGGLMGVELIKKCIGITISSGDLMVFPIILAMTIGRTGCFLSGISDGTFGIESSLPWAIDFGDGIHRHPTNLYEIIFWGLLGCLLIGIESSLPWAIDFGDGIHRHPTNLYEIIFWGLLGCLLIGIEKRRLLLNGSRFKILMVTYLLFRLSIEFIKPAYFFSFGFSVIQLACIAGLIYYFRFLVGLIKTGSKTINLTLLKQESADA